MKLSFFAAPALY
jgi:hypothetical protein